MTQTLRSTGLPTLIPDLDPALSGVNGVIDLRDPNAVAATRTTATVTVTVAGAPGAGDTAAITFTTSPVVFAAITKTYTVVTGDTIQTVAEGLTSIINADAILSAYDIEATTGITSAATEAIITLSWPGPLGNLCTVTVAVTGGVTLTRSASGILSGGAGAVIPTQNFAVALGLSIQDFWVNKPVRLDANRVKQLVASLAAPVPLK